MSEREGEREREREREMKKRMNDERGKERVRESGGEPWKVFCRGVWCVVCGKCHCVSGDE